MKYLIVIFIAISCNNKPRGVTINPELNTDTIGSPYRACDTIYIHDTINTRNIDVNYGDINLDNFKVE